tara:strand:+ start:7612 stop:8139 length:528 start_codon:yes stop_codon:yes gene_type:complete
MKKKEAKKLDLLGLVLSLNKRQGLIKVDISLLPNDKKVELPNGKLYYVGKISGVTKGRALGMGDLYSVKELEDKFVNQYITRCSIFQIIDDSDEVPGQAFLVPVKNIKVARKVLREAKKILIDNREEVLRDLEEEMYEDDEVWEEMAEEMHQETLREIHEEKMAEKEELTASREV